MLAFCLPLYRTFSPRRENTPKRDFLNIRYIIKTNNTIVFRLLIINVAKRNSGTNESESNQGMNEY